MQGKRPTDTDLRNLECLFAAAAKASNKPSTGEKTAQQNPADESGAQYAMAQSEIDAIQNIDEKSVFDFDDGDIKTTEPWARQFMSALGKNFTKSPFFRAWFGDWRMRDQTPVVVATKKGDSRQPVKNDDTGLVIQASGKVHNETRMHTMFFNKQAVPYLPYIDDIIKNAVLLDTYSLKDAKSPNSLMMHSFYVVADIGNGRELLKLYVEEMNDTNSEFPNRRAYQLQNIEKVGMLAQRVQGNSSSPVKPTSDIRIVADLHVAVKAHDAKFNPKAVNEILCNPDDTPKVFYHGTSERFTTFDYSEIASNEGSFFFAENREDAQAYGKYVYEVYLTGENLANYDDQPSEFYRLRNKRDQVAYLKAKGYDGWYADMDSDGWGEVSVFTQAQIKSATRPDSTTSSTPPNIGTFSKYEGDIQYSLPGQNLSTDVKQPKEQRKSKMSKSQYIEKVLADPMISEATKEDLRESNPLFDVMSDDERFELASDIAADEDRVIEVVQKLQRGEPLLAEETTALILLQNAAPIRTRCIRHRRRSRSLSAPFGARVQVLLYKIKRTPKRVSFFCERATKSSVSRVKNDQK